MSAWFLVQGTTLCRKQSMTSTSSKIKVKIKTLLWRDLRVCVHVSCDIQTKRENLVINSKLGSGRIKYGCKFDITSRDAPRADVSCNKLRMIVRASCWQFISNLLLWIISERISSEYDDCCAVQVDVNFSWDEPLVACSGPRVTVQEFSCYKETAKHSHLQHMLLHNALSSYIEQPWMHVAFCCRVRQVYAVRMRTHRFLRRTSSPWSPVFWGLHWNFSCYWPTFHRGPQRFTILEPSQLIWTFLYINVCIIISVAWPRGIALEGVNWNALCADCWASAAFPSATLAPCILDLYSWTLLSFGTGHFDWTNTKLTNYILFVVRVCNLSRNVVHLVIRKPYVELQKLDLPSHSPFLRSEECRAVLLAVWLLFLHQMATTIVRTTQI